MGVELTAHMTKAEEGSTKKKLEKKRSGLQSEQLGSRHLKEKEIHKKMKQNLVFIV